MLMTQYISVAPANASKAWKVYSCIVRATPVNSIRPRIDAKALFLITPRNSDVNGGRMIRNAIGNRTHQYVCCVVIPSALPALFCPPRILNNSYFKCYAILGDGVRPDGNSVGWGQRMEESD